MDIYQVNAILRTHTSSFKRSSKTQIFNMKTITTITFFFCCFIFLSAQDMITLRSGDDIEAKVIEVGEETIVYKKFGNQDGPNYRIATNKVFRIKYQNGETELFEEKINADPEKSTVSIEQNVDEQTDAELWTEELATLIVYRGRQHYAAALNYWIIVNGQKTCKLSNNKYLTIEVPVGLVEIGSKRSGAELFKKEDFISIETEPGKTYYVQGNIKRGIVNRRLEMAEVTLSTAKRDMVKMKVDRCQMKIEPTN